MSSGKLPGPLKSLCRASKPEELYKAQYTVSDGVYKESSEDLEIVTPEPVRPFILSNFTWESEDSLVTSISESFPDLFNSDILDEPQPHSRISSRNTTSIESLSIQEKLHWEIVREQKKEGIYPPKTSASGTRLNEIQRLQWAIETATTNALHKKREED